MPNGWAKIKPCAGYAGVSERTFRKFPKLGLRHVRLPSGTILIKYEWIDEFLENFEVVENEVDEKVEEVCKDFAEVS